MFRLKFGKHSQATVFKKKYQLPNINFIGRIIRYSEPFGRPLQMCYVQKTVFNLQYLFYIYWNNQNSDQITIFGKKLTCNQNARSQISKLVFLTYRQGLQIDGSDVTSDMNWGCLLRVASMAVAQVFKRFQGQSAFSSPELIKKFFIEKNGKFSIERMVKKGAELFDKKIKEWYSISDVAGIIQSFINEDLQINLKVFVCNQMLQKHSCLRFLSQEKKTTLLSNLSVKYSAIKNIKSQLVKSELLINPGLIIIVLKNGLKLSEKDSQQKLNAIKRAMDLQSFAGMLGGTSGRGLYFVGYSQTSFIYLDPHKVSNQNTFHTPNLLSLKYAEADPDAALCFYVENHKQYKELLENIPLYLYKDGTFTHKEQGIQELSDFFIAQQESYVSNSKPNHSSKPERRGSFQIL